MLPPAPFTRLVVTLLIAGLGFNSCGEPAPPPIEMESTSGVDAEVLALLSDTLSGIAADPESTRLRMNLALIYEANQLWHEANQAWEQVLQMQEQQGVDQAGKKKGPMVYHWALCSRQAGEMEQATGLLKEAVKIAPDLAAAHHELAETHLEVSELDLAEAHFKTASRLSKRSSDPLVGLALVHLERDESKEAEEKARRALAIEPDLKRAHYALGLALRGQGRLDEAERELTLGLGGEARNLGDPLSSSLGQFKTGYHARISEAVSHVRAGNPRAAVLILEPILSSRPDDEALLNNLAVAYTHLGQHNKARDVLLKVIELEPTSFPAYINLTAAELELGMDAQAMQHAEAAVRYGADVAKTRFVRARAYMRYARWNEAYADLKKAVQIQGEDALHHAFLGEVCQRLNKHVEAVQEFELTLRLDENAQYVWIELGFSAVAIGDLQKAVEAYKKAQRYSGADNPRVLELGRMISGG